MKTRVGLGVLVCCMVLVPAASILPLDAGNAAAPPAPQVSTGFQTKITVMRTEYTEHFPGKPHHLASHHIYNLGHTVITLDDVFVTDGNGLNKTPHLWTGLRGKTIAPFGSLTFAISATGVGSGPPASGGPAIVAVTWKGPRDALRLTGTITVYAGSGAVDAMCCMESF